jgi:hypothetical protein
MIGLVRSFVCDVSLYDGSKRMICLGRYGYQVGFLSGLRAALTVSVFVDVYHEKERCNEWDWLDEPFNRYNEPG